MLSRTSVIIILGVIVLFFSSRAQKNEEKLCLLRDKIFPRCIFDYWTGYYCYSYTNKFRLTELRPNITVESLTPPDCPKEETVPRANLKNESFYFNYKDSYSILHIQKLFKTTYFFKMWESCVDEAAMCCDNEMTNSNIRPSAEFPCPMVWDGWTCFPPAKNATISKKTCSSQAYSTESDVCELQSQKECFPNGTWNSQTDYSVCSMAPVLRNRHMFNVIVLGVAAVVAFPAVVVFFSLRGLRKKLRFVLHRNLILVIVIRNLLSIMTKKIIILDAISNSDGVMAGNSVSCRVLAFFENAAKNGMYACMLADGFYLHKLIVRPFAEEPKLIYVYSIVFVLSFLPSLIWAVVRDQHGAEYCWMVDETGDQWIIDGFRITILVVNFLLLLDIIRVMIMKLRQGSLSQQTTSMLRATLFLIPLFGVYIIVITDRNMVPSNTCDAVDVYYYVSYSIEGLQGVMVATLFCYMNTDVQSELKNAYRKFVLYLESQFGFYLDKETDIKKKSTYVESLEKSET